MREFMAHESLIVCVGILCAKLISFVLKEKTISIFVTYNYRLYSMLYCFFIKKKNYAFKRIVEKNRIVNPYHKIL